MEEASALIDAAILAMALCCAVCCSGCGTLSPTFGLGCCGTGFSVEFPVEFPVAVAVGAVTVEFVVVATAAVVHSEASSWHHPNKTSHAAEDQSKCFLLLFLLLWKDIP